MSGEGCDLGRRADAGVKISSLSFEPAFVGKELSL